jgi:hypothetical protein
VEVVSVVVPLMLAVLPYASGRGFDTRARLHAKKYIQILKVEIVVKAGHLQYI